MDETKLIPSAHAEKSLDDQEVAAALHRPHINHDRLARVLTGHESGEKSLLQRFLNIPPATRRLLAGAMLAFAIGPAISNEAQAQESSQTKSEEAVNALYDSTETLALKAAEYKNAALHENIILKSGLNQVVSRYGKISLHDGTAPYKTEGKLTLESLDNKTLLVHTLSHDFDYVQSGSTTPQLEDKAFRQQAAVYDLSGTRHTETKIMAVHGYGSGTTEQAAITDAIIRAAHMGEVKITAEQGSFSETTIESKKLRSNDQYFNYSRQESEVGLSGIKVKISTKIEDGKTVYEANVTAQANIIKLNK